MLKRDGEKGQFPQHNATHEKKRHQRHSFNEAESSTHLRPIGCFSCVGCGDVQDVPRRWAHTLHAWSSPLVTKLCKNVSSTWSSGKDCFSYRTRFHRFRWLWSVKSSKSMTGMREGFQPVPRLDTLGLRVCSMYVWGQTGTATQSLSNLGGIEVKIRHWSYLCQPGCFAQRARLPTGG